jgi:sugar phosphate isomerase/epimerase
MKIGIKLDCNVPKSAHGRALFGDCDIPLRLRSLDVEAVEIAIEIDTDLRDVIEHAHACCQSGLTVSLHPYTEFSPCNSAYFEKCESHCRKFHSRVFAAAAEIARHQKARVVVNIHAAAGSGDDDRRTLVNRSIEFFKWAKEWCRENVPRVRPVVELQFRPYAGENIIRIGDSYQELYEIVEASGVDACWDFGHAYMNAHRYELPAAPPDHLLSRIAHIHCHDVADSDHHPLVHDRVPWKVFLQAAVGAGFDGTVILEVPPDNFLAAGADSLETSIRRLSNAVSEIVERPGV